MSQNEPHYFGIRHHGPGSARRLLAALERLQPSQVLIEGPADCSELLSLLAHAQMKPPIALLAYAADEPAASIFYPFTEFSPEYQACLWAISHQATLSFIDLPVSQQLVRPRETSALDVEESQGDETAVEPPHEIPDTEADPAPSQSTDLTPSAFDPIATLATLGGYEDGEAWWNDLIEQNQDDDEAIFATVEAAMAALREAQAERNDIEDRDRVREAYMRLEIAKARKNDLGPIAVICGAWHVPALKQKHSAKADRALLKELPKKLSASKVKTTWIPWTSPRLASVSGYGAGIDAPMWYQHLWHHRDAPDSLERWLGTVTRQLRHGGQVVSTASVIEAVRLSHSLAAVRGRPSAGFEEIRDATIACLCFGEKLIWQQLESRLLLGNLVGEIPDDAPLVPLLEDLQRQQKKHQLKPEALGRELSLDLRSAAGLGKSVLLHRLNILEIPWGRLSDAGGSRGTFRERWQLLWQPEYAVKLVENLVYGSTIEQAANNRISEALAQENHLNRLAETVQRCLESQLNAAAEVGLSRLDERAAHTSDALELLDSLAPLVNIHRYGTAREMSLGHIETLVNRLAIQAALALPYACRNLSDEEALRFRTSVNNAHKAMQLAELETSIMDEWWQALQHVVEGHVSSPQLTGLCARLLYQAEKIDKQTLQRLLQKSLSPAIATADAAHFFEGFFAEAVQQLLYDRILLKAVEHWLLHLEETLFVEYLPLFRRVFSELDATERKRMLDNILGNRDLAGTRMAPNMELLPLWPAHLQRIGKLIQRDKQWAQ